MRGFKEVKEKLYSVTLTMRAGWLTKTEEKSHYIILAADVFEALTIAKAKYEYSYVIGIFDLQDNINVEMLHSAILTRGHDESD